MRMWQVLLTRTVGPWCLCALFYTQKKVLHFVWKIIWQGWYVMFNSSWAQRLFFAPTRQRCQAIIVCWCLVQEYNLFYLGPLSRCRKRKHLMIINLYCLSFPMGMEWRKKKIPISTFCRLYIIQYTLYNQCCGSGSIRSESQYAGFGSKTIGWKIKFLTKCLKKSYLIRP